MFSVNWRKSGTFSSFGVIAIVTSPFGLWPLHKDNLYLRIRCFVPIFQLILMLICSLYEMYFSCEHTEYSVDILLVISFGIIAVSKSIFCYFNRDKLRHNVESAYDDRSRDGLYKIDSSTLYDWRRFCKKLTRSYIILGTISAFSYAIKIYSIDSDSFRTLKRNIDPMAMENTTIILKKRFLFPSACTLNDVSQTIYRIISINQWIQFLYAVGINLSIDIFFITIACHLAEQFSILKRCFSGFKNQSNNIRTRRKYGILVARYEHLLKLADHIEASFNMIIFTQILMNLILLNVAGFNFLISLKKSDKYGATMNFGISIFILIQTLTYACIGENMSGHVEAIRLSIYEGPWQTVPKSISKDMIFLMIRSNTSTYLTAGKFFKMTRSTFTDVVKTYVSYLSVLMALIKD